MQRSPPETIENRSEVSDAEHTGFHVAEARSARDLRELDSLQPPAEMVRRRAEQDDAPQDRAVEVGAAGEREQD